MRGRQGGFTLLEVIVALAILALSLGVLMQIFGSAARHVAGIEQYSRALLVAESQLARVGEGGALGVGTHAGEADRYRWRVSVEPFEAERDAVTGPLQPYQVSVEVRWDDEPGRRVELRTIRLLRTG